MNKVLVLLLFVAAAVKSDLPAEEQSRMMEINAACMAETGVSEETLKQVMTGNFPDDPALKKHLVCFGKKAGCIDENGHLVKDKLIKKLTVKFDGDEDKAKEVFDKCYAETGNLEEDTFMSAKCAFKEIHSV